MELTAAYEHLVLASASLALFRSSQQGLKDAVAVYARRSSSSHNRRTAALRGGRTAIVECQLINQTSRLLGLFRLLLDCADALLLAAMKSRRGPYHVHWQGCILIPEQHVVFGAILAAEIELSLPTL